MTKKSYQTQVPKPATIARAMMKNAPVSLKFSVEIITNIKGKRVDKSIAWLQRIANMEEFLPLRKYNRKIGHKKGEAKSFSKTGKYPVRCVKQWIALLESAKANADYKGLDSGNLVIQHAFASQGYAKVFYQAQGRISGKRRNHKSAHLEVVVREAR